MITEKQLTALEAHFENAREPHEVAIRDLCADLRSAQAERDLAVKIGADSLEGWDKAQEAWERHMEAASSLRARLEKAREALTATDDCGLSDPADRARFMRLLGDLRAALEAR